MFTDFYLETERLTIRLFTDDDALDFYKIINDEAVLRYIPEKSMTFDEFMVTFKRILHRYNENTPRRITRFSLAVRESQSHRLVGWVGLGRLEINPEEIEIYYGMSRDVWGRGYATEAARTLLRYGFDTLGLEKIVAIVKPDNAASIKVVEKIGLKYKRDITGLPEKNKFFEGVKYFDLTRNEYRRIFT